MAAIIAGATLDHVALAVERWSDAWPRYAVELGGLWTSGGFNVGFGPAQLQFANGGRVEILQPFQPEDNPFLRRFLDRHGPGPHHLTFKVPDLALAIDQARDKGFSPVGIDLRNEEWKEAFLHPRQATGIVVQLAQAAHAWESSPPEGFPTDGLEPPASLLRVTHAVRDIDTGLALFESLLGGRRIRSGTAPGGDWDFVDLQWPGPPAFRLIAPGSGPPARGAAPRSSLGPWLGTLSGRLHHLVFALGGDAPGAPGRSEESTELPGLLPIDGPARVVEPADNLGTRLVLTS
jgi:catechol 2,3-dioxygenase-like lactoylglutathione lyase family enzyme